MKCLLLRQVSVGVVLAFGFNAYSQSISTEKSKFVFDRKDEKQLLEDETKLVSESEDEYLTSFATGETDLMKEYQAYGGFNGINATKVKCFSKQREIVQKAFENNEEWAVMNVAHELEKKDSNKSLMLYQALAESGNCLIQSHLANAYADGKSFVKKNIKIAYFWSLITNVRKGRGCYSGLEEGLEKKLAKKDIEVIQDLASSWKVGKKAPTASLEASGFVALVPAEKAGPKKKENEKPVIEKMNPLNRAETNVVYKENLDPVKTWQPLHSGKWQGNLSTPLSSIEFFEETSESVWMIIAATSTQSMSIGSAVAVTTNQLITNCHVVKGASKIGIKRGDIVKFAEVVSGDFKADKCIISVKEGNLVPVRGMRKFTDLKVGEEIYTIGSPKGLESTLSQGIVSGLRTDKEARLVQISAPISSGSSGGGVFDKYGNLIAITTFLLKDAQNMNFSISIEDYFEDSK
ncbi:hypothetical protein AZI85_17285 [Bdellovibrio bacteriovorus]|uniref:Serine protease n=1 Tax=Bdellovibrio bacteriovorus TaxID=959 RepID=A0A150WTB5_BDEBC|nr:trypsin-like peptidase domain-containing protein [Bdellovibrio bacteriovorus]KYG67632.1 hypothetical protein AZI85_17285 [Bdellovibrio bacteriovorus]